MSKQRNIDHTTDGSITTPRTDISGIPKFGWRVNFDYECKEKCDPFTKPRLDQIPALIGLSYRCGYLYQALILLSYCGYLYQSLIVLSYCGYLNLIEIRLPEKCSTLPYVDSAYSSCLGSIYSSSSSFLTAPGSLPTVGPYSAVKSYFIGWFSQCLSNLFSNWKIVFASIMWFGKLFHKLTILLVKLYFLMSLLLRCFTSFSAFPLVMCDLLMSSIPSVTLPSYNIVSILNASIMSPLIRLNFKGGIFSCLCLSSQFKFCSSLDRLEIQSRKFLSEV